MVAVSQVQKMDALQISSYFTGLTKNILEELSFYQVTNRLARLIGQLPPGQLAGPTPGRITQDQLAARLGTVREVVARSLRELERSGAIQVENRQIFWTSRCCRIGRRCLVVKTLYVAVNPPQG